MDNQTADGLPSDPMSKFYAVLGFDPKGKDDGTLTLRGAPGDENTPKMSVKEFRRNFDRVQGTSTDLPPTDFNRPNFLILR